jgi:nitroreductase
MLKSKILDIVKERFSVRKYLDKPIEQEKLPFPKHRKELKEIVEYR